MTPIQLVVPLHLCCIWLLRYLFCFPLCYFFSGRPRDRCWYGDRFLHRWGFVSVCRANSKQTPLDHPYIAQFFLPRACIRIFYYIWLFLFWYIAWFCSLLLLPTCLPYMLCIGWILSHQRPLPLSLLPRYIIERFDPGDRRAKTVTSPHPPSLAVRCYMSTIDFRGWWKIQSRWSTRQDGHIISHPLDGQRYNTTIDYWGWYLLVHCDSYINWKPIEGDSLKSPLMTRTHYYFYLLPLLLVLWD